LTDIVLAHGGTLDKYMDSSLMAVWGAPLPQPDHARRACLAALAMQRYMDEALRERQALGQAFLGLRVGLHSGPVMAGNVGSREHFNYTIMGDTVNLTHRLQGVNRHYGTRLIISDATRSLAGPGFLGRELDRVQVRGRTQPVTIYELVWVAPGDPPLCGCCLFRRGGLPTWSGIGGRRRYILRKCSASNRMTARPLCICGAAGVTWKPPRRRIGKGFPYWTTAATNTKFAIIEVMIRGRRRDS
jgi:hypothetical protein